LPSTVGAVLMAVAIAACNAPTVSPSPAGGAAGILLVNVGERVQARPQSEDMAGIFSQAIDLANTNGDDLGYPWIDPASGALVLSAVTQHGRQLIDAAGLTVPHSIRAAAHGASELGRIQDDLTMLRSRGVIGSELIYATVPDQRDNRVLILISAPSPALLDYLAGHYPPDALAVEVDPSGGGGAPAGAE